MALLDTGASANFISQELTHKLNLTINDNKRDVALGKGAFQTLGSSKTSNWRLFGKIRHKFKSVYN